MISVHQIAGIPSDSSDLVNRMLAREYLRRWGPIVTETFQKLKEKFSNCINDASYKTFGKTPRVHTVVTYAHFVIDLTLLEGKRTPG
jgi:hypothetical protein